MHARGGTLPAQGGLAGGRPVHTSSWCGWPCPAIPKQNDAGRPQLARRTADAALEGNPKSAAAAAALERIKASPRWAGERFRNVHPVLSGLRDPSVPMPTIGEFICGGERRVPRGPLPSVSPLETWRKPSDSGLRATWLGHSTVLIEIDGLRIITDPVWGKRASPSSLAGPKRFQPVPVTLRAMPPVDLVAISHDHYDHLDYPTIRELAKLDVPFVTSLGVGAHLEAWGVRPERIVELDWWESHRLPDSELTCRRHPRNTFPGAG
jgi:hypothetical protein